MVLGRGQEVDKTFDEPRLCFLTGYYRDSKHSHGSANCRLKCSNPGLSNGGPRGCMSSGLFDVFTRAIVIKQLAAEAREVRTQESSPEGCLNSAHSHSLAVVKPEI